MDREQAKKLIAETLKSSFDEDRFIRFSKEFFNEMEITDKHPHSGPYIPTGFPP